MQRRGVQVTIISTISTQPAMIADELRRQAGLQTEVARARERAVATYCRAKCAVEQPRICPDDGQSNRTVDIRRRWRPSVGVSSRCSKFAAKAPDGWRRTLASVDDGASDADLRRSLRDGHVERAAADVQRRPRSACVLRIGQTFTMKDRQKLMGRCQARASARMRSAQCRRWRLVSSKVCRALRSALMDSSVRSDSARTEPRRMLAMVQASYVGLGSKGETLE